MPGLLFVRFIQEREQELLGIQRGHLCNEIGMNAIFGKNRVLERVCQRILEVSVTRS